MKVGDLNKNKHTGERCRIRSIEEVPLTKERKVTVIEMDNGGRWGHGSPLSEHWDRQRSA